jgi:methenyltetrahydromethanopterin cyclohydrolase
MSTREKCNSTACALIPKAVELGAVEVGPGIFDCSNGKFELGLLLIEMISGGTVFATRDSQDVDGCYFDGLELTCDEPQALLACQAATLTVSCGDYFTCASGPALLRTRSKYSERLGLEISDSEEALVFLESEHPPEGAIEFLEEKLALKRGNLKIFFCPAQSNVNSVQVHGRALETAYKRILDLGGDNVDANWFVKAEGGVVLGPQPKDNYDGFCRPNEMIMYSARVDFTIRDGADVLPEILPRCVSAASSKFYGLTMPAIMEKGKTPSGIDFSAIEDAFTVASISIDGAELETPVIAGELSLKYTERALGMHDDK